MNDSHPAVRVRDDRRAVRLERQWQALCAEHLPVAPPESVWRYSRAGLPGGPGQGWKLHVSATILTAGPVLGLVAEELRAAGVLFKAPRTLAELYRLNCGYFYGSSQIGKFLTVYPSTPDDAARLAARLDALTRGIAGPAVPFERPYSRGSRIFYRYGSFESIEARFGDETLPALRTPDGTLVPDPRTDVSFDPAWCPNPFRPEAAFRPEAVPRRRRSRFGTRYLVAEPLTQRGKGGVYKALDVSETPVRLCVIKEGRRHGETDWGGRDGRLHARNEGVVLRDLAGTGVRAPSVRETFDEANNHYVVLDYVGDRTLEHLIRDAGTLPVGRALGLAAALAELVASVHDAGWAWRDIKPRNVVVDADDGLHAIDFEGACRPGARDVPAWGSEGYVPPEWQDPVTDHVRNDLFGLGVSCYQLLAGRRSFEWPVREITSTPLGRRRHHVPPEARRMITALMDADPARRPPARVVAEVLAAAG